MRTVVLMSGGLDSAVLLARAVENGDTVCGLSFYYGSKHGVLENRAAQDVAKHYNVPWHLISLEDLFRGMSSALLGRSPVPEGHYNEESMRQTVVPGRNMLFLAVAAAKAEAHGWDSIQIGAHAGDHFIYPDCRPEFLRAMFTAIRASSDKKVELLTPFMNKTKYDIVKLGTTLKVPFGKTRTCYTDNVVACGRCASCQERLEAFAMNGEVDPLEYTSRKLMEKS